LLSAVVILTLSACANLSLDHDKDKCVKLGQEWAYDHRDGEEASKITIVDAYQNRNKLRFYVIRVTGIRIESKYFENYFPDRVAYFVISEPGLMRSLTYLVGEASWNKYFDPNYIRWRKSSNERDYYGFTVKDKIKTIEDLLNTDIGT